MTDSESGYTSAPENPSVQQVQKRKRTVSDAARQANLENLKKAHAKRAELKRQRAAELDRGNGATPLPVRITKYPRGARDRAQQMFDDSVKTKAKDVAKSMVDELLAEREREKELEEFRAWKSTLDTLSSQPQQRSPSPEAPKKPKRNIKEKKAKPAPRKAKQSSNQELYMGYPGLSTPSFDIGRYLG
jgi:hypothetical protein